MEKSMNANESRTLGRRELLKALTATGGAALLANSLPSEWITPIVEIGTLPAHAQISGSLSPIPIGPPIIETLCPTDTHADSITTNLTLIPNQADILFAIDTTGSMGEVINQVRTEAEQIFNNLSAAIPDIRFGIVDFRDYAQFGDAGVAYPYLLALPMTNNFTAFQNALDTLSAAGGGDDPEAYSRVLFESYSDPSIGYRVGTRKFLVMFGDNIPRDNNLNEGVPSPLFPDPFCGTAACNLDPGRDETLGTPDDIDLQGALAEMSTNQITLLYIDASELYLTYWNYWAGLTAGTGQAVNLSSGTNLSDLLITLIGTASQTINSLTLEVEPASFASWLASADSFTDVNVPETGIAVTLDLEITAPGGTTAGTYNFDINTVGDGTIYTATNVTITVPSTC